MEVKRKQKEGIMEGWKDGGKKSLPASLFEFTRLRLYAPCACPELVEGDPHAGLVPP
jgi:hypothetical protein